MAIKSHLIDRYWLFYVRISRDDFIENELSLLLVIFFVPEWCETQYKYLGEQKNTPSIWHIVKKTHFGMKFFINSQLKGENRVQLFQLR